jgi:hypothetical protein
MTHTNHEIPKNGSKIFRVSGVDQSNGFEIAREIRVSRGHLAGFSTPPARSAGAKTVARRANQLAFGPAG